MASIKLSLADRLDSCIWKSIKVRDGHTVEDLLVTVYDIDSCISSVFWAKGDATVEGWLYGEDCEWSYGDFMSALYGDLFGR